MTVRHAIEIDTILLMALAAVISGVFVWNNHRNSLPVLLENTSQIVIPIPVAPKVEKASQVSPDGSKNLIMTVTEGKDGFSTYSFATADSGGANRVEIYSITAQASEKYSLPFNAWSPDNKYLFIYKNDTNALVFRADGDPIVSAEQYIDLESVFKSRNSTNMLKQATGWADPSLVVFNTTDKNGQKASFWLEVPSKAIIPLSTQF